MKDTLKDFLQHLRRRDVSRHTLTAYENDVATFLEHTSQIRQKPLDELAPADVDAFAIRAFLGELHKQRISATSSARKLSAIRTFVKFLRRDDLIEDDPASLVAAPKKPETIPAHLTIAEMSRLLEMPDTSTAARPPRPRDSRALLCVGAAVERAGRARHGRREPVGAHGARDGQGQEAAAGAVQHEHGRRAARVAEGQIGCNGCNGCEGCDGCEGCRMRRRGPSGVRRRRSFSTIAAAGSRRAASTARAAVRRAVRREVRHQPARAAALIRHPSARERRRPARDSGAAGSCPPQHDPALHARQRAQLIEVYKKSHPRAN